MTLSDARLYLVAPARLAAGPLDELVPELVAAGVDLIQLREKNLEAGDLIELGRPVAAACQRVGVPFIVNDRPDVAIALDADGVHLGQDDLPIDVARRVFPQAFYGLSTHSAEQITGALLHKPDYIGVGPVNATPTKPGRPGTGMGLVAEAAELATVPWFITGGMNETTIPQALAAGGRRFVVVRAIVEAEDPVAATQKIRGVLDEVQL